MNYECQELVTAKDRKIVKGLKDIEIAMEFEQTPVLKLYSKEEIPVTDIVVLLNSFGIICPKSISYKIEDANVNLLVLKGEKELIKKHSENIKQIMKLALSGKEVLNCPLYILTTKENFHIEHIRFLRAMTKYLNQLILQKREKSIVETFIGYSHITRRITEFFFDKKRLDESIFKPIKSYEEDKLFRIFYHAVKNIVKTNFFESDTKAFKFDIKNYKHLLWGLQPNIEIFVYDRDFLGVHLRSSKIARGGIRWSDRDDFREEIKSLMITQEAKNSIIVPSGAKGGFFIERRIKDKDEFKKIYSRYINAMLDVIDSSPKEGEDFYFVVAADKGTSSMSDTANEIALKRGFWLGDAFASGGSRGYNHKELGVTAKGAWISAARHFTDKGIDIFQDSISVVGTGSMRGDVFGNGMLINPNIKLIGAISSKEIFIDPNPDTKKAYRERKRLFEENLSWSAYKRDLISKGGGVFYRDEKEIELSEELKKLLKTRKNRMSGAELARRILCLSVDMLYIGGVGTYVKSSEELNIQIADKINEEVRVDANELGCYAVCEGGNLGFTQKGRIEYAKGDGKINLDSIDNSAGVHTSDYEVNLKIALNSAMNEGKIDLNQRDETLFKVVDEVMQKVFMENRYQPLAMTLDEIRSKNSLEEFIKSIELLEKNLEYFKRKDYSIPKNKEMDSVLHNGALVRPILGILLSFSKIFLKNVLLGSQMIDEPFFEHYLYKYFPKGLYPFYEKEVVSHPLKREIIATVMANLIIDSAGVTFIGDFEELGEELFLVKIKTYLILNSLLSISKIKNELVEREKELKKELYDYLLEIDMSLDFSLKWVLRNYSAINMEPFHILNYKKEIADFLNYEKGLSENFFKYIDLIKFIMLAIFLKESKEYKLTEILNLLMMIINRFKIDLLLQNIYSYQPKNRISKDIKNQLIELVEYFVTVVAKDIIIFTRAKENLEEGFNGYLEQKRVDFEKIIEEIEKIEEDPNDLTYMVNVVQKLLLQAI